MKVGIPRERKTLEKRVALSPQGAKELTSRGHEVLIETEAGAEVHFYDRDYTAVGARICKNLEEVWGEADLLVKVKEPHKDEYPYFREDLALFDYLHLAGLPDVAQEIQQSKMCAIAYESVRAAGRLPLLEPMSEIAGKLSVINGSYFLLSQNGGRGILIGGAIGVPKARVAILGAGVAGRNACEMALGLGADVTLLDVRHDALESAKAHFGSRVNTSYSTPTSVMEQCQSAELLIGSVLIPGAAAPKIVSREAIKLMKPGSVFVDISIDQGGCGETMRPTSLDNPVFEEEGVLHYGVTNMPSQTARTSTLALTAATLPYIVQLADKGINKCLKKNKQIRNAVNCYAGHLCNEAVAESLGQSYSKIEDLL